MVGIPLSRSGDFTGSVLDLLQPYTVLAGLVVVAMFAMHGSLYLFLKLPDGHARQTIRHWMWHTWGIFLVALLVGHHVHLGGYAQSHR